MAAWAAEDRKPGDPIRPPKLSTPLPTPCPDCNQASFGDCECLESGPTCVEAFPVEVWEFFDDAALDQLITEAAVELGRRELARLGAENA